MKKKIAKKKTRKKTVKKQELIVKQPTAPVVQAGQVTEKMIDDYLFGSKTRLTDEQKTMFKKTAVMYNLNPFKREVYAIPYGDRMSIITGYEVYLKRANKLKVLDGWGVECKGSIKDNSLRAIVTIHRKDWSKPFIHDAYYCEYNSGNKMWREKPITMIKKVATAQAFRLAFPDELDGLPYTTDEMPPGDNTNKQIDKPPQATRQPAITVPVENTTGLDNEIETARTLLVWTDDELQQCIDWVMGGKRTLYKDLNTEHKKALLKTMNAAIDKKIEQGDKQ